MLFHQVTIFEAVVLRGPHIRGCLLPSEMVTLFGSIMHLELVTIFEGMARTIFESMLVDFVELVILVFHIHASF